MQESMTNDYDDTIVSITYMKNKYEIYMPAFHRSCTIYPAAELAHIKQHLNQQILKYEYKLKDFYIDQ